MTGSPVWPACSGQEGAGRAGASAFEEMSVHGTIVREVAAPRGTAWASREGRTEVPQTCGKTPDADQLPVLGATSLEPGPEGPAGPAGLPLPASGIAGTRRCPGSRPRGSSLSLRRHVASARVSLTSQAICSSTSLFKDTGHVG